jgi:hypothetical protein
MNSERSSTLARRTLGDRMAYLARIAAEFCRDLTAAVVQGDEDRNSQVEFDVGAGVADQGRPEHFQKILGWHGPSK